MTSMPVEEAIKWLEAELAEVERKREWLVGALEIMKEGEKNG